jgi:flagellar basal-body rod protein FlgB
MKSFLFDQLHGSFGSVLELRQKQHALTTGNIANADTPHYKAKFIRFDTLLDEAVGQDAYAMRRTHEMHLSGFDGSADDPAIEQMKPPPWAVDGNSVQLEKEAIRLKENSLMFRASTTALSKRLGMLRYVAGGGK